MMSSEMSVQDYSKVDQSTFNQVHDVTTGMQFIHRTLPLGSLHGGHTGQHDQRTESLSCRRGERTQRCEISVVDYTQQSVRCDQIY